MGSGRLVGKCCRGLRARTQRAAAVGKPELLVLDCDWDRPHERFRVGDMFVNELDSAFTLIGSAPHLGHLYRRSPFGGVLRVLLPASQYHVYYVALDHEVRVLARVARPTRLRSPAPTRVRRLVNDAWDRR